MKVIAINGSPHSEGNTFQLLRTAADVLAQHGIETEIVQVGHLTLAGCQSCGGCAAQHDGRCALPDDGLNAILAKMGQADGILLGSPVHYAGISGAMKCFLDRAFYASSKCPVSPLRHKVGAALTAVRRTGGMPALQSMYHYLSYMEMLLPSSNYWAVVHGRNPEEVLLDEEGMQTVRLLAENMAWLLSLRVSGGALPPPEAEAKRLTNFIRP